MGLFDPAWMTENEKKVGKAVAYVGKVTDDAELATIARQAHFTEIKLAAVERVADQAVLASIAIGGEGWEDAVKTAVCLIDDPVLLDSVARGAEDVTVRRYAIKQMKALDAQADLSPYAEIIAGGVRAANSDMLVLSEDLELMEQAYDRHNHENYSWSKNDAKKIRERANEVARERVERSTDVAELDRIASTFMYDSAVRDVARRRIETLLLPEDASQQQLFDAACASDTLREAALARLTDEGLLSEFVTKCATLGCGQDFVEQVDKISDKSILERIARDESLEFQTRRRAAGLAGIEAPFGTRTLVCRECAGQVVYHEAYESYDSWDIIGWFRCEKHYCRTVDAGQPLEPFELGEVAPEALDGHLLFLCPGCMKLVGDAAYYDPRRLAKCTCGATGAPIPVRFSIDY